MVATAAFVALLLNEQATEFAGLKLFYSFPGAPSAVLSYKVLGHFPLLAPIKSIEPLKRWFVANWQDRWDTTQRIRRIVAGSNSLRLTFFAAENDEVIEPENTEKLFSQAVQGVLGVHTSMS